MLTRSQAGLFSAVTSAFIIQVGSQLRPDPGDETAALLRVLIYKIDNTTFGNDVPALPQWTGPPLTIIHVQAILFASLFASLLSAFLAMLGKQWLNRYTSTDLRGSAIERSQNRQRKLDGIIAWYFDSVMESLPLMLQVALLLLGCALSRYLWEVSITIASVVLGVTSLGLLFYLLILVAGTAWDNCPYQTPGSHFLRYLGSTVQRMVHSAAPALGNTLKGSMVGRLALYVWDKKFRLSWADIVWTLVVLTFGVPLFFVGDVLQLCLAAIQALGTPLATSYHLFRGIPNRLRRKSPTLVQKMDHQPTVLGLRCISWTLRTSLDKPVHLSSLNYLVTITQFTNFDPALVIDCFNILVGYISISGRNKVVAMRGLEQLATLSARCFFQTLRHLSATHPDSSVLADLRRRYRHIFSLETDFRGLLFYNTMTNIHALIHRHWNPRHEKWTDYLPSDQELIPFARHMVDAAQAEYQQTQHKKIPRWILRFALHFLSLNRPSPVSVIADCLTIIAIALDLDPSGVPVLDERYVCSVLRVPTVLTKVQCTSGPCLKPHHS